MAKMSKLDIELMESSQTAEQWNNNCDTIKGLNDGNYPDDWWEVMKLSGRMDKIFSRWNDKPKLTIEIDGVKKDFAV